MPNEYFFIYICIVKPLERSFIYTKQNLQIMKTKSKNKINIFIFSFIVLFINIPFDVLSQNVGDYRSRQNGDWNNRFTWQRWDGNSWEIPTTAQGFPTENNGVITIRSPHRVTVNEDVSANQLIVNTGATLNFTTSVALIILTITDGPGVDFVNNGTIIVTDSPGSDSRLIVNGQMENNGFIRIEVDCHIHVFGTLVNNSTITTDYVYNSAVYSGKLYVFDGGVISCSPSSVVDGGGDFALYAGATIEIGSPQGITLKGTNSGNIQTNYLRFFSEEANYVYNGTAAQVTGSALSAASGVTINNPNGIVTFSDTVNMNYLIIESGSKANLNTFTHTAGALILPENSYAQGTWGSSISPAINVNNVYFDSLAAGILLLTNTYIQIFNASSTLTTCSTDTAYKIIVETWGGGGRGGSMSANGAGGGGGGGAYSRDTILSVPGHTYSAHIGEGSTNTNPGGDTWFSTSTNVSDALVLAKGGNSSANNSSTGATGGSAASGIGVVKFSGGNGADGYYNPSNPNSGAGGGGGSSAGINANGNTPTLTGSTDGMPNRARGATAPEGGGNGGHAKFANTGPGNPGGTPGGGGGGSYMHFGSSVKGGNGSIGRIKLSYPPIFPYIFLASNNLTVCKGMTSKYLFYNATTGCPDVYKINFDAAANNSGFIDIPYTSLPLDSIEVHVPDTAPAGVYHGILSIQNSATGFPGNFPITVTINDPNFTSAAIPVSCYGANDGSIRITITSSMAAPYSFSVNNGLNYNATYTGTYPNYYITNLQANTYKIRIKDQAGCETAACP